MTSLIPDSQNIIQVAVPGPFQMPLSYLSAGSITPGCRVLVPLGTRQVIGIVVESESTGEIASNKLKAIIRAIDEQPILCRELLAIARWMSRYYLHEFSSAFLLCLPTLLRKGESAELPAQDWVKLSVAGEALAPEQLKNARKQQHTLIQLQQFAPAPYEQLQQVGINRAQLKPLMSKGLVEIEPRSATQSILPTGELRQTPHVLNEQQQQALDQLCQQRFAPFLLEGVTGSGKTEVYLQAIEHCLKRQQRALILVPEIGLTPQTVSRFQQRFADPVVAIHSGLSEKQRQQAWLHAQKGQAAIVIGTRSAVLTPLPNLGLIVIDEEHDQSFKQQDSLRYQARDVALKRAQLLNIPIILGSATPSLETLHNAISGRFGHLLLNQRAAGAHLPSVETIDMRKQRSQQGLSERLLLRVREHLNDGNQVLLFLNRRGYAPSWFCEDCGWIDDCVFCDAHLTHHRHENRNLCHHCGHSQPVPKKCPNCGGYHLSAMGTGTERAEELLQQQFPSTPIIRFDRDAASTRNKFEQQLAQTEQHESALIIGTQMLAKGHHFERVTLVGIWDVDVGLFSADLRARERMGQLLTQVAGRSGRGKRRGEVLIQTHYPDNPLFTPLLQHDYRSFAANLLAERKKTGLPPFGFVAVIRCDSAFAERAEAQLQQMVQYLLGTEKVRVLGPIPALLSRRAGKHRFMVIVQAEKRSLLHEALTPLHQHYPREAKQVSWHIDIDPADLS